MTCRFSVCAGLWFWGWLLSFALALPAAAQSDIAPDAGAPPAEPAKPVEPVPEGPLAPAPSETAPELPASIPAAEPSDSAEDSDASQAATASPSGAAPAAVTIRYFLEEVRVIGNRTRSEIIRGFVPLERGAQFDVDDPAIEEARWRLLGTGWFDDVKLSLARGSQRGWVVLQIEVKERNTLLVDQFVMGLSRAVSSSTSTADTLRPYVGLGLAETNLFGWGVGVNASAVVTAQQYGINLGYQDQRVVNSGFSLRARFFHNYAREFFGRNPLVSIRCPPVKIDEDEDVEPEDLCDPDVQAKRAVVIYHRTGVGFGTGHEMSSRLRYTVDWLGEFIDVGSKPQSAVTQRGNEVVPIDFRIDDGRSIISSLRFGVIYDDRDHPALTQTGDFVDFNARFGSHLFGSSYDFARFEFNARHWFPLPLNHVLSLGMFLGTVFGNAPFFYNFYAADLSDLLPSRVLELNLDRRRTLNLLGTSIVEMDMEDLAARIDVQYQLPLHRGGGFMRGVDGYIGVGVFLLTRREDLRVAISGYSGIARVPLDLTFDLGVQADTEIGLFKLGFSSLIGFSPLGRETP